MRLLRRGADGFEFKEFVEASSVRYAVLSHRWFDTADEVTFRDIQDQEPIRHKRGYKKLSYTHDQAEKHGIEYIWVDTCCIDKSSSAELSESINSMFKWYKSAAVCYAFLWDIPAECPTLKDPENAPTYGTGDTWRDTFVTSEWFRRGWTLQEMIAPSDVRFYGRSWNYIGSLSTLAETVALASGVDRHLLQRKKQLFDFSVAQKMSWAAHRKTTRVEDQSYCLMGLFDINMPMLYGEGAKAFQRLQEEIIRTSTDQSIFAWLGSFRQPDDRAGSLFGDAIRLLALRQLLFGDATMFALVPAIFRIVPSTDGVVLALLNCYHADKPGWRLALRLKAISDTPNAPFAVFDRSDLSSIGEGSATIAKNDRSYGIGHVALDSPDDIKNAENLRVTVVRSLEPGHSNLLGLLNGKLYKPDCLTVSLGKVERQAHIILHQCWPESKSPGRALRPRCNLDLSPNGVVTIDISVAAEGVETQHVRVSARLISMFDRGGLSRNGKGIDTFRAQCAITTRPSNIEPDWGEHFTDTQPYYLWPRVQRLELAGLGTLRLELGVERWEGGPYMSLRIGMSKK